MIGLTLLTFLRSNESIRALDDRSRLRTGVDSSSATPDASDSVSASSRSARETGGAFDLRADCMSCSTDTLEDNGEGDGAGKGAEGPGCGELVGPAVGTAAPTDGTVRLGLFPPIDTVVDAVAVATSGDGISSIESRPADDAIDCRRSLTLICCF